MNSLENLNFQLPSDKSISHRLILAALFSEKDYKLLGLTLSQDIQASLEAVEALGISIERLPNRDGFLFKVNNSHSLGLDSGLQIDCLNSGTTARLLIGILAGRSKGQRINLIGDASLSKRPMGRVTLPLIEIGAKFSSVDYLPIENQPSSKLSPIHYRLPIASAQVKSALLFAAIQVNGESELTGLIQSRDHTEKLFLHGGVKIEVDENYIRLSGPQKLKLSDEYQLPADPSAGAFWCLYAALTKSKLEFSNILLNPTRLGFYDVIEKMGCLIKKELSHSFYEQTGSMKVNIENELTSTQVDSSIIPSLIDEIPILCILMALSKGGSIISGVSELKYKESNRLKACLILARAFGAEVIEHEDAIKITPNQFDKSYDFGELIDSGDHRIIMILAIISKAYDIPIVLKYPELVNVSYPQFWEVLEQL